MTTTARMIVIGVVLPLLITAGAIIAIAVALPDLPSPVAVHWGLAGNPDGLGSPAIGVAVLAVVGIGYAVLAFAVVRVSDGATSSSPRVILALSPAIASFLAVLIAGSTVSQSGLSDGRDAPSIFPALLAGFGIAIVVGVVAWLLLPDPVAPAPDVVTPVAPIALGATERASWMQRVEPSRGTGTAAIVLLAVVIVGGGVAMALVAPTLAFVIWMAGMLLVGVVVVSALFWSVRIDSRGLMVRSVLGFPRFVIPAGEVANASTINVIPLRDFSGWGVRGIGKRIGVIVRSGEAMEVTRRDGRVFVVTVPQSREGAALLNAVAARV